jgi:hypothetical protein
LDFIALTIVGELIQDKIDRRAVKPTLMLIAVLLVCAAAINLNPYGIHYWSALRPVGGPMFAQINEWKPLWKPPLMAPEAFMVTALLGILALAGWAQNPQRRVAHLLWLLFAIIAYVTARRQIQQFAQVSLIVMAANAAAIDTRRFWNTWRPKAGDDKSDVPIPRRAQLSTRLCVIGGLLLAVPASMPPKFLPLRSLSPRLPVGAAQFIQDNARDSRLLTDYASSSYMNWHLAGNPPLFIDLINAYPDHLLGDYFDIIRLKPQGLKNLDDLKINHIFIQKPADDNLTKFSEYMTKNKRWKTGDLMAKTLLHQPQRCFKSLDNPANKKISETMENFYFAVVE